MILKWLLLTKMHTSYEESCLVGKGNSSKATSNCYASLKPKENSNSRMEVLRGNTE